jgi:hypothetical protein
VLGVTREAAAKTVSYGIAIGYNQAPQGTPLPTLRYADDDAVRYFRHFRRLTDEAALLTILDDDTFKRYPELRSSLKAPTWRELETTVKRFAQKMQQDRDNGDEPVLYFAYSGHGAANARGAIFLTLADAELTQDKLYDEILQKLPFSFAHLFVDACHAEAVVGARGMFDNDKGQAAKTVKLEQSELQTLADAQRLQRFPTVGAVIATTIDQEAHEWSRLQSGVFTHEVLSGLSGAADTNGDGAIEYSELQAFVMSANRGIADPRAAPHVLAAPPLVNRRVPIVTLDSFKGTSVIEGGVQTLGHFYIELENGERYLDANLGEDRPRQIVVPQERVLFVRTQGLEAEISTQNKPRARFADLRLKPRQTVARGSIDEAYRTALFASPYTASYYQGVVDSSGLPPVEFGESKRVIDEGPTKITDQPVFPFKGPKPVLAPSRPSRQSRWIGLQVTGAMDALGAFGVTTILFSHLQVAALFDAVSVGFNFEARGIFLKSNWSPYVSVGGKVNIPRAAGAAIPIFFQETHFNIGLGAQYFNPTGFYLNLGIVWIPPFPDFVRLTKSSYLAVPLPHVSLGWAFEIGPR